MFYLPRVKVNISVIIVGRQYVYARDRILCLICALFSSLAFVQSVASYSAISYACVAFSSGRVVTQSSKMFQKIPDHVTGFAQFKLAQFFVSSEVRESSLVSVTSV